MKKYLVILIVIFVVTLSSCTSETSDYNYSDFYENKVISYYHAETKPNKYVLYYYSSESSKCDEIKDEILSFFDGFDTLNYYLLDTSNIQSEESNFGKFTDEPIIYLVSNKAVYETYTGSEEIKNFINKYEDLEITIDLFESQHITSMNGVQDSTDDSIIIYYYNPEDETSVTYNETFLPWAYTKNIEDIFFINVQELDEFDELSTDIQNALLANPSVFVMSYGQFAQESYTGPIFIDSYLDYIGNDEISGKESLYDYADFSDHALTSFDQTLTISDNLHLEYYYSPYCSHCNAIKSRVLAFFSNNSELEYYIINSVEATGNPKIEDYRGVPALYIIDENNEVVASFLGSIQIPKFINDYNAGLINLNDYTE